MSHLSPIEWIQEIAKNCLNYVSNCALGNTPSTDITFLKSSYDNFSKEDLTTIHTIFSSEFEVQDRILLLSYILQIVNISDFSTDAALQIYNGNFDFYSQIMLEIQLLFLDNIDYQLRRDIHRKSVSFVSHELSLDFSYLPLKKRNKKRIAIITEQLLDNFNHAPTLMTLQTTYTLQQHFGYEVLLLTCASNKPLAPTLWTNTYGFNSGEYGFKKYLFNDVLLPVYQYPLASCSLDDYKQMMTQIYNWNPLFVLNMGVNNPIADLPRCFTTVVCRDMSITPPVSEADILIRGMHHDVASELIYKKANSPHQIQVFMTQKFPAITYHSTNIVTRTEFHLPENKFLIAIVGNHLDTEIDKGFLELLFCVLNKNSNIDFVIIGDTSIVQTYFTETLYQTRVHFLGYCTDLLGTYQILDLYLNPRRSGGGWSSAIALKAGLPVITLPNCDVAYNVSDNYIVSDYEKMYETIMQYSNDTAYYHRQSKLAKKISVTDTNSKIIEYITELLTRIKEALPND